MSPGSLGELKRTIARALQDFVELESEDAIEVRLKAQPAVLACLLLVEGLIRA